MLYFGAKMFLCLQAEVQKKIVAAYNLLIILAI